MRDLAAKKDLILWDNDSKSKDDIPSVWDIYFDHWSRWQISLDAISFMGIHAYRHPLSQILSATRYHLISKESWLHIPRKDLGGKSYQESLVAQDSFEQQVIFEMNRSSKYAITEMLALLDDSRFFHLDIENASRDPSMTELKRCHSNANLDTILDEAEWLAICKKHCLWAMETMPSHSTAGINISNDQVRSSFTPRMREEFRKIYGEKLALLCFS